MPSTTKLLFSLCSSVLFALLTQAKIDSDDQTSTGDKSTRCWSTGNGESARWWDNGARIDRGKYWYECQNGELVPKGCFAENGDRVELNGHYVSNGYEVQCAQNAAGYLEFRFTGCSDGERVYHVGDTWENKERMYYFECRQDGPYVKVEVAGCVSHDKSRRIPLGQQYDFGNYTYECQRKYNGSIQLCSVGCIHNGEHIKVGEQFPDGDFLFYCKSTGGVCQKVCVGCQVRNKRLYNGDRIRRDNSVFQCLVRREKYGIKPVACVDDDGVERVVGCRWNKQAENSKVEQTCEVRSKRAVVKTLGCIFVHKGYDILFLYPNTWTIWTESVGGKSIGVACRNTGDEFEGKFSVDTFDVDNVAEKTVGLHFDQPRGK